MEKGEEASSRGNGWEVLSPSASTFSAAPSSEGIDDDVGNEFGQYDEETDPSMFMSDHFVFPPSEHENLPLEPDINEIENDSKHEDEPDKMNVENRSAEKLQAPNEFHGVLFFDEKGNSLSAHGAEFEGGPNLLDEEKSLYSSAEFNSSNNEADISRSNDHDEHAAVTESCDPSQRNSGFSTDLSKSISRTKEVLFNKSELPCKGWWKKRVASLYTNAKEVNSFWTIFVAATLMGLVILGHRRQQNKAAASAT